MGLLLFASVNLGREALEALRSNRLEIRFYRELHQRRVVEGRACVATEIDGMAREGGAEPRR